MPIRSNTSNSPISYDGRISVRTVILTPCGETFKTSSFPSPKLTSPSALTHISLPPVGTSPRVYVCVPGMGRLCDEPVEIEEPPEERVPRMERMMRRVIDDVITAAMLVTIVLIGSAGPVGLMMNQKSTLTICTIQMACKKNKHNIIRTWYLLTPYKLSPSRSISFQGVKGLILRESIER